MGSSEAMNVISGQMQSPEFLFNIVRCFALLKYTVEDI